MSVLFYAIRPCNDLDTIVANGRKQTVLHLFLDAALKTVAYLRVSTRSQDLANQKLTILEFSQKRRFPIDRFIESRISSRQSPLERRIEELLAALEPGDRLLVSELSRLGRSLSQVIQIVDTLVHRKIRFIAIKEGIEFDGKQDLRTREQCRPERRSARSINVCERMDEPWRLPAEVMCRVQHEKTWSSGQRGCILRPCQGQNGNPGSNTNMSPDLRRMRKIGAVLPHHAAMDVEHFEAEVIVFHPGGLPQRHPTTSGFYDSLCALCVMVPPKQVAVFRPNSLL